MTGCIPQPLVQLFTSFLQFFTVFFTFFTVFYKAVEWAGDFGAGDLGGLQENGPNDVDFKAPAAPRAGLGAATGGWRFSKRKGHRGTHWATHGPHASSV